MDELNRRTVVVGGVGTMATATLPFGSAVATADADSDTGDGSIDSCWGEYLGAGRKSELDTDLDGDDRSGVDWRLDVSSVEGSPVMSNGRASFSGMEPDGFCQSMSNPDPSRGPRM